jgi:hypothetical protein
MVDVEQSRQPSHSVYSVVRREGQPDAWLSIGLVFPHKEGDGFNVLLQEQPLSVVGEIVCRKIGDKPSI